ncbi:MAG TPA: NADP-dependent oxidoreductase, partial [Afipia sp.]
VLPQLNDFARIPVCGLIAGYSTIFSKDTPPPPWANSIMRLILVKRLNFRGFIVRDFAAMFPDFIRDMPQWIREGKLKHREFVTEGIESAPAAFMGLLKGANFGKQIVRVAPDKV